MDIFEGDIALMVIGICGIIIAVAFFTMRWWADWFVDKLCRKRKKN